MGFVENRNSKLQAFVSEKNGKRAIVYCVQLMKNVCVNVKCVCVCVRACMMMNNDDDDYIYILESMID